MKKIVAAAAFVSTCLMAFSAAADPAFTANKPQVGANLQYGVYMGDDGGADDPLNPYGLGLNLRGGYTLDFGLYVGAGFDYFFGETEETEIPGFGSFEVSTNIYQFGAEVGYDVGVSPTFVLRPKLGLGLATAVAEVEGGGDSDDGDESGLAISPGVQALFDVGSVFVSADVRYNILSIEPDGGESFDSSGLLIGAGVGAAF